MLTIEQVADHILDLSKMELSNRELQKILYFAQGFHLAKRGEALFTDSFHAWDFGPVNTTIWHKFKDYGYRTIFRPKKEQLAPLDAATAAFLSALVIAFSSQGQSSLIEYTHADIPWAKSYIPSFNAPLPKEDLKEYFSNFRDPNEYLEVAKGKLEFHNLIQKRRIYLSSLPALGDNWISGTSFSPSEAVCIAAKHFISSLERLIFANNAKPEIPKLVFGPIPSGGVGLELSNSSVVLYVNLHNDTRVEVDVEKNGNFSSEEISFAEFEEDFTRFQKELLV